jgi:hypothetical protein
MTFVYTVYILALGPIQTPIVSVRRALPWEGGDGGLEADHSPPHSVEIMNAWSYSYISALL